MVSIKKATPKDSKDIVTLFIEFMKEHEKLVINNNPYFRLHVAKTKNYVQDFRKFILKNIKSKNSIVMYAEENGKPAGYCLAYIKKNIPIYKINKLGYLSDIFVRKNFRKLGISSKMKDESFKWFVKKGVKYVSIIVYKGNKARVVYKHWGFKDYLIEMRMNI